MYWLLKCRTVLIAYNQTYAAGFPKKLPTKYFKN